MERPVEAVFGSIEGAAEYVGLLLESVNEARLDLESETALSAAPGMERRREAIQLATYKLSQLKQHLTTSHRLLNDLRTIRRLLFAERQASPAESTAVRSPAMTTAAEVPPLGSNGLRSAKADASGLHREQGRGPRPLA